MVNNGCSISQKLNPLVLGVPQFRDVWLSWIIKPLKNPKYPKYLVSILHTKNAVHQEVLMLERLMTVR